MFVNFQINIGHNQFKTAIKNTEVYFWMCFVYHDTESDSSLRRS